MAPIPTSAFCRITWEFAGNAAPNGAVTSLGITRPDDLGSFLEDLKDLTIDELVPFTVGALRWANLVLKVGPESTGETLTTPIATNGGTVADGAPPNVAYLLHWPAVGLSQRFAGRQYIPGVNEGTINDGGAIANGTFVAIQNRLDAFATGLLGLGVQPVAFSTRFSDPTPLLSPLIDPLVATQRRRLRR